MTPDQWAGWDTAGDTGVHGPGVARAVRRATLLVGLVSLAEMTEDEIAWVFATLVE